LELVEAMLQKLSLKLDPRFLEQEPMKATQYALDYFIEKFMKERAEKCRQVKALLQKKIEVLKA
jgi:hypothetical protein